MNNPAPRRATLYRMAMPEHLCPWGLKALHLLRAQGYRVDDRKLRTRAETDAFMAEHGVWTTPQSFLDGRRICGYDDLRRFFGKPLPDADAPSYRPVIALFGMTAAMAVAASMTAFGTPLTIHALQWFIAFSMCVLALLKLQDVERFSSMFLGYDLLARRWVPYATLYPFLEAAAGVLMVADVLHVVSIPIALVIGGIGAASVIKAVYIDKREIRCACVGGDSRVPLGAVSLAENLMMVGMAAWMLARAA
jgi:glutaredoxin